MTPETNYRIVILSDATGETAAQMVEAAMVQFASYDPIYIRHKNILAEKQILAICEEAEATRDLIVFTIVSPQLRAFLIQTAREKQLPAVDLLGTLLLGLGNFFGHQPKMVAGLLHGINDDYFDRIDAMEYTIQHDDGRDLTELERADLVIVGISRTSKTPLSMYLSTKGWKVANIPMITGYQIPKEVFAIDQTKVVGLTIDLDDLTMIRRARLERLGHERGGDYADPSKVQEEIDFANEIYRRNRRWPIFNVTGKALEETASEIIKLMSGRKSAAKKSQAAR